MASTSPTFDLLLRGGSVVDGAGNPATTADVGIQDERIVAIGRLGDHPARRIIDVDGLTVTPGFVDMHAHSDLRILSEPAHTAKVAQGITTELLGQDGLSYAPVDTTTLEQLRSQLRGWNGDPAGFDWSWRTVGEYLDRLDAGAAANAAYLVPHGTVRMLVVGQEDRVATPDELAWMARLVEDGMRQGAVGLSAGLTYTPGMYATDDELVELCHVVARHGGFYAPHHRNYGAHALQAYADCFAIARRSGVSLHLTHAHLGFSVNQGRAGELLAMVDQARADGLEVTLDSYPYLAGSTYLHAQLPAWVQEGGVDATVARLRDQELRERLRVEIEETGHPAAHGLPTDWTTVVVSGVQAEHNKRAVGRSIAELAESAGKRAIDVYCELLADEALGATCVLHIGNEDNVQAIMAHPHHCGGSDGILVGDRPHPRAWGTFPRYLGHYVRELGVLRLEDAVRKFTSLPAQRLGQWDRGLIRPGHAADIAVFDPAEITDVGSYDDPCRQPIGLPYVIVNGVPVIDDGVRTDALPGRSLRSTAS